MVQLKAGESSSEDEIKQFCQGKIAHFKIPELIRFADEFPMDSNRQSAKIRNPPKRNLATRPRSRRKNRNGLMRRIELA